MALRVALAVMCMMVPVAGAQASAQVRSALDSAARRSRECDSVIVHARVDSAQRTVRAYLVRTDDGVFARDAADLLLQEFAQRLHPLVPLHVPVFAPGPTVLAGLTPTRGDTDAAPRELLLQGVYDFTLLPDGGVSNVELRLSSLSPAFDDNVIATIEAMGRDHALPLLIGEAAEDSVPLRLRITSGEPLAGRSRALFTSVFPRVLVTDAVAAKDNPVPAYPLLERSTGQDGYVLLQLVVSREGRVQPGTIEVLQATTPMFTHAAVAVLDSMKFTPARVGSCAVPQMMRLPFRFVAPVDSAA